MLSYAFAVMLFGLGAWLIFTKMQRAQDAWIAEVGKLCFFAGLLAWLFSVQGKSLFGKSFF